MKRFRVASVAAALSATLIIAPTPFASAETPNAEEQTTITDAEKNSDAEKKAEENKDTGEDANPELTAAEAALERAEKKLDEAKAELTKIEQDAIEARKAESEALKKATGDQAGKLEAARIDNEYERSKNILAAMEKVSKAQADYDRATAEVERIKAGRPAPEVETPAAPEQEAAPQTHETKGSAIGSSELPGGVNPVTGAAVVGLIVGIIAAIFSVVAVALPMLPQIVAAL